MAGLVTDGCMLACSGRRAPSMDSDKAHRSRRPLLLGLVMLGLAWLWARLEEPEHSPSPVLRLVTVQSYVRPSRRLRLRGWWLDRRLGRRGRELRHELDDEIVRQLLFGSARGC